MPLERRTKAGFIKTWNSVDLGYAVGPVYREAFGIVKKDVPGYVVGVGCGSGVIVVRLVPGQFRMVACLLLAFVIVVPTLCLVIGVPVGRLDRCIAISTGIVSFVAVAAFLLDRIIVR